MIQRVQSIFLLLSAILMALTAISPILGIASNDAQLTLFSYGIQDANETIIKPTWGIVTMAGLSALITLIAIFSFKNRKKQIKLVNISSFLVIAYYLTTAIYMFSYFGGIEFGNYTAMYGIIFPVLAFIFNFMAIQKIRKDEKLVRSLDRIR